MRTAYKGHTILAEATRQPTGGWAAHVKVFDASNALDMETLEMPFATPELAEAAALLLGRTWVDSLEV